MTRLIAPLAVSLWQRWPPVNDPLPSPSAISRGPRRIRGIREFARELHARIAQALHVSIHPSVTIGSGLFIDHGTGITIGEGVVIGEDVSMLQEVTLSRSPEGPADAPRIGRGVLLSAGATVLGTWTSATLPRSARARWCLRRCRRGTPRSACRLGWFAAHPTRGPRWTWISLCREPAASEVRARPARRRKRFPDGKVPVMF